ncbi:hypothetical protein GOP47_0025240 [Adiantum capillus-veneris]|uniref:RING-type domain-containing protein n=1 Tax=Adiantum capillus-veneris TaxID=13818 RepID=A0A9D4Z4E6_ADICA|nr:hypothetical protein GOP47_0025240 [Adiantum capillus-veneris]
MEETMVEHCSRRRQICKLFSDPEGSPELWNEIQSLERGFDSRDWCNLAFDAAHRGQLSLLKWLIHSKKIPFLIRNRKGCNLLHAAASFGQELVAEWLLDRENYSASSVLFCGRSNRKRTPLEIAVCSNRYGMIRCLLDSEIIYPGSSTLQIFGVVRHCCQIAEPVMKDYLVYLLRTMEIKVFFFDLAICSRQNINEILPKLAEFFWWENRRDIEWNEHEKFAFYITLQAAARSWNKELITWLLDEWKVSLKPPSIYKWDGLSITDVVAMGEHVNEDVLKDLGDAKNENDYHYFSMKYSNPKKYFDMMVSGRWTDGQCSSLIASLEPLIYNKEETDYFKNKWFEALCEKDFERRLQVLEIFAKKYDDHGAESFALPRLDLVIACGQLHILKWFIDKGFVDLNLPLSSNEEMDTLKDDEDEDEEEDNVAANDSDCAICYRIKRFPVELQCGHSYCLSCIRKVHTYSNANMQSFQCPCCRRHLSLPPSMTISSSLQYHLKSKSPWLQYKSSNTLGEILMALAAGTGSVFILEHLITRHNLDPLTTLYANGRNLMHLAASRPNLISCKWLCFNGYLELATRLCDEFLSPVHEAINNSNYAASLVLDLFSDHKVLPGNWIDLALVSPNASIVHTAEWTLSHEYTAAISKLLATNAPLDILIAVINKSTFGKCEIFDEDDINSQLDFIIQCGRVDVLIWLYNSDVDRQCMYFNKEHQDFIRKKIGELDSNRSAMEAFMKEVETAEKLRFEVSDCYLGFQQMIIDGAPVVEIESVINHQKELMKKAQNLILKTGHWQISFDGIVRHGLNPLETAVCHGHLHLIKWILKMPDRDITEGVSQIFSQAVYNGSTVVFKFILSWLKENNQPLPTLLHIFNSNFESPLHAVVSAFVTTSSFMLHDADDKVCKACFEMAQILVDHPDVNVNALNEERQTALFHLARIVHFQRENPSTSESAEIIADRAFKLIQMLICAGTDLHHIDTNNRTFFEVILEKGSRLLMKAIRWLVLEKGIDIQFAQFSCLDPNPSLCERVDAEFNAIREEQLLLQLQKR